MSHSLAFHTSALQERLRRGIGLLLASIATLLRGMTHVALLHCIKIITLVIRENDILHAQ